jgi:putative spermidine/putrescine transport system permease protein
MNYRKQILLLALPASLLLLIFFLLPMFFIFVKSLSQDGLTYYLKFFGDEFYRGILLNTIYTAFRVTLFALLLGYPAAYYIARTKSKLKNVLLIATVFPFLVSALVRAYGWMVILGDNGLLNQILLRLNLIKEPLKILYTMNAVTIGLVHLLIPYMILSIASVVQNIDPNLESAAESLGANRWQTFRKVIFPLSLPGVITGCILVFTVSMTAFVTPKLLGGARVKLMSSMVYQEVQITFNWSMASTISFILLAAILVVLLLSNLMTTRAMARLGGGKSA